MQGHRSPFARLLQLGFCVTAILVAGLALYPNLQLPEPELTRGFTDKIYHVVGCAVLMLFAAGGWSLRFRPMLLAIPCAIGMEFVQVFAPGRGVHMYDMIANIAGVLISMFAILLIRAKTSEQTI